MKVYVLYQDQDNSCGDPECCGGPYPYPTIKIFSSPEAAKEIANIKLEDLVVIDVDKDEFQGLE